MSSIHRFLILACALLTATAVAAPLPAALEPWREWVLHGQAEALCPRLDPADAGTAACRWPGELQLDVDAEGARFVQTWTLHAPQRVPLPGDGVARPVGVEVDGRASPVTLDGATPVLQLEAGSHRISGRITWQQRPSTLALPSQIARVALHIDGVAVALPQRNEDDALVLGATAQAEGDAVQVEVYRLLADGSPPWLATRVVLSVAGRPRELLLGPILPPGHVPVALDGELPLRLEADGRLRVQLRPGDWSLTVIARAPADRTVFAAPAVPAPWPAQELWQFRAAPQVRIAQLDGVPGIDPQQADLPDWEDGIGDAMAQRWDWLFADAQALPAFVFMPGGQATLAVSLRGLPPQRPPRVTLQRELWLDFDGDEVIARDRVSGDLGGAMRFDMRAPWLLEQARRDGEQNLLVTRGSAPGLSGIEWRDAEVGFEAGARVAYQADLPASGWDVGFDSASAMLNLPPGYRLLGARGADAASGSWVEHWSLLDLFLCSVVLLLAWRVQPLLAPLLAPWLAWSWHEPDAPQLSLMLLLALVLLLRHVAPGRWQRLLRWARHAAMLLVVVWSLLFAATQLRLALHPQLERSVVGGIGQADSYNVGGYANRGAMDVASQAAMPSAPPPPRTSPGVMEPHDDGQTLDRIEVAGSRIKRMDLFQYPADAIPQAGNARPDWQWHRHLLRWNGPLTVDDTLDLWISPPWLTRALRVLAVLLLGAALALLLRPQWLRIAARGKFASLSSWAVLSFAALAASPPASAQGLPDAGLLQQLRERLTTPDQSCQPHCAALSSVLATTDGPRLRLLLEAHAQAEVAWPLPRAAQGQALVDVRVDAVPAPVLRAHDHDYVLLQRGVHRVELVIDSADARWRIEFPLPPASVETRGEGLEVVGVDDGRLIGDTLELVGRATAPGVQAASRDDEAVPPFVRVRRILTLDQQWTLFTQVERIAPERGGLTVPVPLLPGELPLEGAPPQRERMLLVSLAAGADSVAWSSRLTPADEYTLTAGDGRSHAEEWRLDVAPLLHAQTRGVPLAGDDGDGGAPRFLPLPGERLHIAVSRPEAVQGATLAIEGVGLQVTPGQRARDSRLEFTLRSTRAGQHRLPLPRDAELLGVWIDGVEQPRVLDAGDVVLPLRASAQRVTVSWRDAVAIGVRSATPELELGAGAANLKLHLAVPADRWLLATRGPGIGPAVLYWSHLVLLVIVAWALARWGGTVLRFHHWLLLGLGFSTVSWIAAAIVAGWLLLLGWRGRRASAPSGHGFALMQIALLLATLIALLCLVAAIPYGLLGSPDMQVTGNGSWAQQLNWFLDRTESHLPSATAYSLPLWLYKTAILLWALWLANALLRWLRWGWICFGTQGRWYWPPRAPRTAAPTAANVASPPAQ